MSFNIDQRPISNITEKINCPQCTSTKVYSNRKWFWDDKTKNVYLLSDWTCRDCKHDFEGEQLDGQ